MFNLSFMPSRNALPRYSDHCYEAAQVRCRHLLYCADLPGIYAGKSDLYGDPRRPNPERYCLLGEAIIRSFGPRLLSCPRIVNRDRKDTGRDHRAP